MFASRQMPADHSHPNAALDRSASGSPDDVVVQSTSPNPPKSQEGVRSILQEQIVVAPQHLGVYSYTKFRRTASALIDLTTQHTGRFIVDCAGVESIDSAGLNALIIVQRRAAKRHVQIVLAELSEELRSLLVLTKLNDLFHYQDGDAR